MKHSSGWCSSHSQLGYGSQTTRASFSLPTRPQARSGAANLVCRVTRSKNLRGGGPKLANRSPFNDWASSRAIQKGETSLNEEIDILAFDGTRKTISNSAIPILDEQKNIQGAIIVNQDMTGEKRREREREAILTVSAALRSASTRDEMVTIVCQQLNALLAVDGIAILIQPEEQAQHGSLTIGAASGCWSSLAGKTIQQDEIPQQAPDTTLGRQINLHFEDDLPHLGLPIGSNDTLVGVPLETRDGGIGAVWMVKKAEFNSLEISVTTAVADITANALHRLALFERTSQYAEQMRVVSEIGHTLAETMDLPGIYAKLAEGVLKLYADSAAVMIALFDAENEIIGACMDWWMERSSTHWNCPPCHWRRRAGGSRARSSAGVYPLSPTTW